MNPKFEGFFPDKHLFFDHLSTMLMSVSSYLFTLHVSLKSDNPTKLEDRSLSEWISYIAPLQNPERKLSFLSNALGKHYVFYPFEMASQTSLKGFPQQLKYEFSDVQHLDLDGRVAFQYQNELVARMVGSAFVGFYEAIKDRFEIQFGEDHENWPAALNFARHVRDGFLFGGQFYMIDPSTVDVHWRGFTASYHNNGQDILFAEEGMDIGDIILLMDDMNSLIVD